MVEGRLADTPTGSYLAGSIYFHPFQWWVILTLLAAMVFITADNPMNPASWLGVAMMAFFMFRTIYRMRMIERALRDALNVV